MYFVSVFSLNNVIWKSFHIGSFLLIFTSVSCHKMCILHLALPLVTGILVGSNLLLWWILYILRGHPICGINLKVEFLSQRMYALVILKDIAKWLCTEIVPIYTPTSNFWRCLFSYILANLLPFLIIPSETFSNFISLQQGMSKWLSSGQ